RVPRDRAALPRQHDGARAAAGHRAAFYAHRARDAGRGARRTGERDRRRSPARRALRRLRRARGARPGLLGTVIGAVGILRDMRELDKARAYAESLIKFAPDPVFVSDLEGKILQANDAVSGLLGFRADEVIEQSLSRFISPEETREF